MDFVTDLSKSEGYENMIVVTDRLSKGVITDGLENLEVKTVTRWFIHRYYLYYFLPFVIISDRGT